MNAYVPETPAYKQSMVEVEDDVIARIRSEMCVEEINRIDEDCVERTLSLYSTPLARAYINTSQSECTLTWYLQEINVEHLLTWCLSLVSAYNRKKSDIKIEFWSDDNFDETIYRPEIAHNQIINTIYKPNDLIDLLQISTEDVVVEIIFDAKRPTRIALLFSEIQQNELRELLTRSHPFPLFRKMPILWDVVIQDNIFFKDISVQGGF